MPRWPKKVEPIQQVDGMATATDSPLRIECSDIEPKPVVDEKALFPVDLIVIAIERAEQMLILFDDIVKADERDNRRVAARNGIVKALTWLKQIEGGNK